MSSSLKFIGQYHSQDTDIEVTRQSYWEFPFHLYLCVCVCVCAYSHVYLVLRNFIIHVCLCILYHTQSIKNNFISLKDSFMFPFYNYAYLPKALPTLTPVK